MDDQTFILALMGIIMGASVVIVTISKIAGLIQAWLGRNRGYDEEEFERLAHAFTEYRKHSERRLRNLEAIAASEKEEWKPALSEGAIEIKENPEKKREEDSGPLKNMLRS